MTDDSDSLHFDGHIGHLLLEMQRDKNPTPLLEALGCRRLLINGRRWLHTEPDAQPKPEHEGLLLSALMEVARSGIIYNLSMIEHSFALLDGLSRNDHWQRGLSSLDDAYEIAVLLLDFSFQAQVYPCDAVDVFAVVTSVTVPTLNTWLRPKVPFSTHPGVADMASAMFGAGWLSLIDDDDIESGALLVHIRQQRPPFLPGLVTSQCDSSAEVLPQMDIL